MCVVHRPHRKDWSLPKGKRDAGELMPATAWRETWEETGLHVRLGIPLTRQRYKVEGRQKIVDYWTAQRISDGSRFKPNREIDKLEWLPPKQAKARLSYARDRDLIDEALSSPRTSPLIILRHAQAMKRSDYSGRKDQKRPITKEGRAQARALIPLLQSYGISELHSSSSTRCLETLNPMARRFRLDIRADELFSEEVFARRPKTALSRVRVLARRPAPLVLCTHRPVLPALLEELAEYFGLNPSSGKLNPSLSPAGAVVFHRELSLRGRPVRAVAAVERYDF